MSASMDVDSPKDSDEGEKRLAVHPLAIVHMSDQYTRITCGGSPLKKDAPVVGLLFGCKDDDNVIQIRDADDIPTDITDSSMTQVELHRAVFPQHSVLGWYRVSLSDEEPTSEDLKTTQQLKEHCSPESPFCFCLLKVQKQGSAVTNASTMSKELPISLYDLHKVEGSSVLLGVSNWQLETSEPERVAVERVMKEQPMNMDGNPSRSAYVSQAKSVQNSLNSMKERVQFLISFLEKTQQGKIPPNHSLLRQVQVLMYSLGPLGTAASSSDGISDVDVLTHLAAVAKTVNAVQSYTDKFRVMHENRTMGKELRRAF